MTLSQYFRLVDTQARMALKADSAQYHLGYIWWILEPLLYVAVFYVVFDVILGGRKPDFLVFLMCGKLPFVWFSKSVTHSSNSIVGSAGLIGKINVPKSLFPMAVIQEGLYKQSTVFLLLFAVVMVAGYMPTLNWVYLLPIMLVQYLMIIACGFIAAILVCYVRDISMLISLFMTFLMFVSGIFWDVRTLASDRMADIVLTYNPLAYILDAYRQVLMHNTAPSLMHLLVLGLLFTALATAALQYMRYTSKDLALRAITS